MQTKIRNKEAELKYIYIYKMYYKYILMRNRGHFPKKLCYIIKHMLCQMFI